MDFYIIIPAHNEENTIGLTLESLVNQTLLPKHLVVVNDNSSDNTNNIISAFTEKYNWISLINITSSNEHIPGAKVINAFYKGLEILDENYDVICKYDADIIFPKNYLESIAKLFKRNTKIGIAGGIPFVNKKNTWVFETVASKNHVRGPIKSYRKKCFIDIGGLKKSVGWDSIDVLLAQYYGWKVKTNKDLHVKHLKPTGKTYSKHTKYLRGEALYKMRFGFILTLIASIKSALKKRSFSYFFNSMIGFFKAKKENQSFIVNEDQGRFIRHLHWTNIRKKVF
ncbi:glycosyltransferase [Pontimicrobium aquaticum]|uniref:Glycosyltransferase family 2 protein n=1 Tax=Pontimicrobium aquaticum TaxID=2565367 RepID=A0A4V5LQY9_9FLAO|nr:glycosyltransferase family 2 protein [Pontimicrobium aquaticum]TJY37139.1 glycosyltransferase family 2 protein [Pontimicrobium aquaticum]